MRYIKAINKQTGDRGADGKRRKTMGGLKALLAGVAALVLFLMVGAGFAVIREPDVIFYGLPTSGGVVLTNGTVTITVEDNAEAIASYEIGSDSAAGQNFVLRVPIDDVDSRLAGTAREGDGASIYINDILSMKLVMPEKGTVVNLNADTNYLTDSDGDGMPDRWELDNFGGLGRDGGDDINGNGTNDLAEYDAGNDPARCVWNSIDGTHVEACVSDGLVLKNCMEDAEADLLHNRINIVGGTYAGGFIYNAAWGEDFDLDLAGGYGQGCSARSSEPGLTVLDGEGDSRALTVFIQSAAAGKVRVEGLHIRNGEAYGLNGGGIYAEAGNGTIELSGNKVSICNAAEGGGIYINADSGTVELENNTVYANTSDEGGGAKIVASGGAKVTLLNNTITDNTASSLGGGVSASISDASASFDLYNNILYANSAPAAADLHVDRNTFSSPIEVKNNFLAGYQIVSPAYAPDASNKNADPMFINSVAGNYHLLGVSNCIDSGAAHPDEPLFDFEGDGRVFGSGIDIGADEYAEYELTVNAGLYGIVNSSPSGIVSCSDETCTAFFSKEIQIALTGYPEAGAVFGGWAGCDSATGSECLVTVKTARTVGAVFNDISTPVVSVTSPSSGLTGDKTPALAYSASEGTVVVKVDGTAVAKVSGDSLDALTEGPHTIRVEATDGAGNTGSAEVGITVDTIPPSLVINAVATPTNINSQTVTGTVEAGATVNIATDTAASDGAATVTGTAWSYTIIGLTTGANNITVTVTDAAGNGATVLSAIAYDASIPTVSITSPSTGLTGDKTPALAYSASEGTVVVKVDGTAVAKVSGDSLDALTEGPHMIRVEATDGAGNTGSAEVGITVDTTWAVSTAAPSGGVYGSGRSVSLSCDDGSGSGCTTTYYCLGNGCSATTLYSGPISIVSSTELSFYSTDAAGNPEPLNTEVYTIASISVTDSGSIGGVERASGGSDSNSLQNGKPAAGLSYDFMMSLMDSGGKSQYARLYMTQRSNPVPLDFYSYDMTCTGDYTSGAECIHRTKLGPASVHKFYFEVKTSDGALVRYPSSGYMDGPTVYLLTGYNIVGAARSINSSGLAGAAAFSSPNTYRWNPDLGHYTLVTSAEPARTGEGYFVLKTSDTLPELASYGEVPGPDYTIELKPGWNLISNPYAGNVRLSDLKVLKGASPAVTWRTAATNGWLTNAVYYYKGSDWGSTYSFESEPDAVLVPWVGYWVYLSDTDDTCFIVVSKP